MKVKLKDNIEVDKIYGGVGFNSEMARNKGKIGIETKIDCNYSFVKFENEQSPYIYSKEMIEEV